jgi:HSP20 family molecular chaperone IbpA
MEDGVLTIKLGVNEPEEIKPLEIKLNNYFGVVSITPQ